MSVLAGDAGLLEAVIRELAQRHGDPDFVSEVLPFAYTNYYAAEMGPAESGFRRLDGLIRSEELPAIKLETNALEGQLSEGGARRSTLTRATWRSSIHSSTGKVFPTGHTSGTHLRKPDALYRKETYRPLEWTYPD